MAIIIDRTGLEVETGRFYLTLSPAVQGIAWEGLFDVVVDKLGGSPSDGRWVEVWRPAPGWLEVLFRGHRLSIQTRRHLKGHRPANPLGGRPCLSLTTAARRYVAGPEIALTGNHIVGLASTFAVKRP